jgi:hypothetical protein
MIDQILPKPLYGEPCNGCGRCCLALQCPVSLEVFGDVSEEGFCPALEPVGGGRLACGLMSRPLDYLPDVKTEHGPEWARFFRLYIGAGTWCDSEDPAVDDPRRAAHAEMMNVQANADRIEAVKAELATLKPWEQK